MILETFPVGPLRCNCSIIAPEAAGEAMVIDPGDNVPEIMLRLSRHALTLKQIVVTHAHIDHVGGALLLKRATGAPILLNERDLPLLDMMEAQAEWLGVAAPEVASPDIAAIDGLIVALEPIPDKPRPGAPSSTRQTATLSATVLHTPGHTEGSICLHLAEQKLLFAGDTLFAGSIGRTDLPGGDTRKIIASIRERLLPLPDETSVVCGHGARTTIGNERRFNPFL